MRIDRNSAAFVAAILLGTGTGYLSSRAGFGANALLWGLSCIAGPIIVCSIARQSVIFFGLLCNLVMWVWLILFVLPGAIFSNPSPGRRPGEAADLGMNLSILLVNVIASLLVSVPIYLTRRSGRRHSES